MNSSLETSPMQALTLAENIQIAIDRIAPSWPLDRLIAVNPYWGWVGRPIAEVAAKLGTLAGTRMTMPREWFRAQWSMGHLQRRHLQMAAARKLAAGNVAEAAGLSVRISALVEKMVAALQESCAPLARLPLVTDLRDRGAPPRPGLRWSELVTHQISQHCAAFFDRHQASWAIDRSLGLYESWRRQLAADHGLPWRQGRRALRTRLEALPKRPESLILAALDGMGIPEAGQQAYLSAVLMSIGGWASWCAYERWQARLSGADDDQIVHLLAIRLAWEWLLLDDAAPADRPFGWTAQWGASDAAAAALLQAQHIDWLLQSAMEIAYQLPLIEGLSQPLPAAASKPPTVQALFCIDVRSEVFRRALEFVSPAVQTRGFAGFFGLPIAYSPLGSPLQRPQLPGLLAPAHVVSERGDAGLGQVLAKQRRNALQWRQRWGEFRAAPASAFNFVETMGLLYGAKLLADSLPTNAAAARWEDSGLPAKAAAGLRPCLPLVNDDPAAAAAMARGILGAMGLVSGFAPLVLLVGHGSHSTNNPHAAGLDCGACGGQTGEVNSRVIADLLNNQVVREHLRGIGVEVPDNTHFLPALHNTTTDEVLLYDTDAVPAASKAHLVQVRGWLDAAGARARAERADSLGLGALVGQPAALKQAVLQRANDWAQPRPEWGLTNNAAFIVAPRARSRHLDLAGRAFLHDYDHRLDPGLQVLTLIMTAPMVVTNWINMQYHASTVDPQRYGSGNKLLHNVVGGHIGVFEGNGGDLRIGLPWQSLHDGHGLRHTPLRLSVFIEAPRSAIDQVIAAHETVHDLIRHGWIHLLRIEPGTPLVERWAEGRWVAAHAIAQVSEQTHACVQ
ncbi:MAG: DUF2309 domain-containing protein [Ideonella sp.]